MTSPFPFPGEIPSTVITTWQNDDFGGASHDFTSTATLSITPDTTGSAVTFTADAAAGASAFDRAATGIVITPNASTDWNGGTKTAPTLEALVSDLIPGYDGTLVAFVQARITSEVLTANGQTVALALNGATRTGADFTVMGRQHRSASTIETFTHTDTTSGSRVADATVYNLLTWILRPNLDPLAVWGQWAGEWPDPRAWIGVCRDSASPGLTTAAADLRAAVAIYQWQAGTVKTGTLVAMRAGSLAS